MKLLSQIYLSIFIQQLRTLLVVVAKETCTMAKFVCYQCDSRVDDYCNDPFKITRANRTVECSDYCVKFFHFDGTSTNQTFVRRGCLNDYFLYRLPKIDVCYRHTTGSNFTIGRFCMCAKEMCNTGSSHPTTFSYFVLLITLQLIILIGLKRIFS
ncbi:unnamed protein product [Adineta ricciae]|uniref:Protein quiver n=1 Tax=Adineta ricciae TaxID=249248 RepID=A0A814BNR8_ADIRI|nr:unnamed protein product [Adineta ricciae]